MMIQHVLMKVGALDLTDTQKKELARIKEEYIHPMVPKVAYFKISHMNIINMLYDPDFDPARLKSEINISNQLSLEMADAMADALTAIRKTERTQNFTKMIKMTPMHSGMTESGMMMEKGEKMGNEPAQEREKNPPSEHKKHHL